METFQIFYKEDIQLYLVTTYQINIKSDKISYIPAHKMNFCTTQ
jgi:hypothetical protein